MFRQLSQAGAKLANLVLPHQCVVCRNFAESTGLCARCWRGLSAIAAPVCRRCGLPLGHTLSEPICASCFTAPPPLAAIRAALHYNDSSRKLILAFGSHKRQFYMDVISSKGCTEVLNFD